MKKAFLLLAAVAGTLTLHAQQSKVGGLSEAVLAEISKGYEGTAADKAIRNALNIYSSLTMLIIEKRGDIATLRSLGAPEAMTRRIFLLEGWLISLLGLGIGLILGIACVWLQQKFGFIRMPGNYIINAYPVILKASDILWTALGVAGVGYLIALLPSFTKTTDNQ